MLLLLFFQADVILLLSCGGLGSRGLDTRHIRHMLETHKGHSLPVLVTTGLFLMV